MPLAYTISLGIVVVALFATRLIPRRRWFGALARPLRGVDAVVAIVGVLGLALHCGAMFYRGLVDVVPALHGYVSTVNAMGFASVILFVVPSALVLVGLRRQHRVILGIEFLSLVAVGVTMYDNGPLRVHLTAIFVSVTIIAAIGALFVSRVRPTRGVDGGAL